jgi:hypothetical protein
MMADKADGVIKPLIELDGRHWRQVLDPSLRGERLESPS